ELRERLIQYSLFLGTWPNPLQKIVLFQLVKPLKYLRAIFSLQLRQLSKDLGFAHVRILPLPLRSGNQISRSTTKPAMAWSTNVRHEMLRIDSPDFYRYSRSLP